MTSGRMSNWFHRRLARRAERGERGYVLAFTAIILIPLLAISAMATDIGAWYDEATEIQKAADAAALAGVVWLPDFSKARSVALETTKANGYDDAAGNIEVVVTQPSRTELKVSIKNDDVAIFFASFFIDSMEITREAVGNYVLPVPLGSPKNYFGTGNMALSAPAGVRTATENENMWAALNGYCSPREQGDPFAARYQENWPSSGQVCPGSVLNQQYVGTSKPQYEYSVYAPPGRTRPIVVHLYSPGLSGDEEGANTISNAVTWTTTFTLRSPDSTPFDDSDNPVTTCGGTGETNPRSYGNFNSTAVPNAQTVWGRTWSRFCTIPATAPSGTYLLGVRNQESTSNSANINAYSIVASYDGTGQQCDARTDAMCPTVNGRTWMSVRATASTTQASLFLAEVGAEHAGKTMEITLFDPGEGGDTIEILDPAGNPTRLDYYTTDWSFSGTNRTSIDVSDCENFPQPNRGSKCRFNDRFLVIQIELPADYATKYPGSKWWKVRYKFGGNVTDRTTWTVRIIGDPVHLSN